MNRLTIAAAVAVAACAVGIPTVAALASDDSTNTRGPSHSRVVDDRSGPNRGSDDVTQSPSIVPTSGASEAGDDNGTGVEPGDDNDTGVPGDDNSGSVEPGDDNGGHGGSGDGGHHGHGG